MATLVSLKRSCCRLSDPDVAEVILVSSSDPDVATWESSLISELFSLRIVAGARLNS